MRGALPLLYPWSWEDWRDLLLNLAAQKGFSCAEREWLERYGKAPEPEQRDLCSTLLLLYAHMLEDTTQRLNRAPEKHRYAFLNGIRAPRLPARSAQTVVIFEVAEGYGRPVAIPENTQLCAERSEEGGAPILYRVKHDFIALPTRLDQVYWTDKKRDTVWGGCGDGNLPPFTPWSGPKTGAHYLDMVFRNVFCNIGGPLAVRLSADVSGEGVTLKTLADPEAFVWTLITEDAAHSMMAALSPDGSKLCLELSSFHCTAPETTLRLELRDTSCLGIHLNRVCLSSEKNEIRPGAVLSGDHQLDPDCFYPFGRPLESCGECFLFCDEALFRPGAEITLTFDVSLETMEETLPKPQEVIDFKWIMRRPRPKPEPVFCEAYATNVCWEYWNGMAYCPVPLAGTTDTCFHRSEKQISLTFLCPEDMTPLEEGGCCLRLSCGICEALYRLPRRLHTPRVENLRFAYRMPVAVWPDQAVAENFGERRVLNVERPFAPFCPPPCPQKAGRALYFGLDNVPAHGRLCFLFHMEQAEPPSEPVGCYMADGSTPGSLQPLDTYDETRGLTCTGILTCLAPSKPVETERFGKKRYWICIAPPPGTAPPHILGIYLNAQRVENRARDILELEAPQIPQNGEIMLAPNVVQVRVCVTLGSKDAAGPHTEEWKEYTPSERTFTEGFFRMDYARGRLTLPEEARAPSGDTSALFHIRYDVSDGAEGNVPAGAISQTQDELPFIARVYNPIEAVDGCAAEEDARMADRLEHMIYSGGRAVTAQDYELAALDACPLIRQAKCETDPARKLIQLAILLPKEMRQAFPQIREELESYFAAKGCLDSFGWKLEIFLPDPIKIKCTFILAGGFPLGTRASELRTTLTEYADPVAGGAAGEGWPIGVLPGKTQLELKAEELLKKMNKDLRIARFSYEAADPGPFGIAGELDLEIREAKE